MALVVKKFGGTSVADLERIAAVAERVKRSVDAGDRVAVVASAMAGETDRLVGLCRAAAAGDGDPAEMCEYDSVVAAGEQISTGLLALTLQRLGVPARSWTGWQVPVRTLGHHGSARVDTIDAAALLASIDAGVVPVVAGFQGVDANGRIATLGRGGSDTSAVALAAALGADRCDIYTDVDGVFTTDPRIVAKARKLDRISFEEMLEMASQGAKVLQTRSVAMAMQHGVRLQVLSSFNDRPGTLVVPEGDIMEQEVVSGLAYSLNESRISVMHAPDRPGVVAAIFSPLSQAGINVDMIVQTSAKVGEVANVTFTVPETDLDRAVSLLEAARDEIGYKDLIADRGVVKISAIGLGMKSHSGVAETMFKTLSERAINVDVISTSEIKLSVLIKADYLELALRALHAAYGLDAKEEPYGGS
ncbi:aspartate kinase [Rhodothalassium salexigens]|uniref:aspartate kinase n=1 Tax=Rhodothalassium salexigens TaxID=1086 RepID=UPI001914BE27|nr:aspartate kinase [Rhodothalassium salexigens]MBK5911414.1 aspartate kinase [Rhodothalassium salexigens]MBK5920677.1 aspartate kinase [Rhodothalassium salexigens]